MKVKVHAKLNLTLNVLGVNGGFHVIDSLAASVNIFDVVTVNPRSDTQVTVSGLPSVADEQNTAYKAACGFIRQFNTLGADIAVEKHIPFGAGMGGSSADAAAVVYALCKLYDVDVNSRQIHALCAKLGSDVNYMLRGGLGRLRGKGDDVTFGNLGSTLYFALTTFNTSMSTAEVYAQFDKLGEDRVFVDNGALFKILQGRAVSGIAECFNNHLQPATAALSNYACDYLRFCGEHGLMSNMTGSGSAYYVPFINEQSAQSAAEMLNANGFQTVVCHSVLCGIEQMR